MNIPKYWTLETVTLELPSGPLTIKCWGGSSISDADARKNALAKAEKIKNKINGSYNEFKDYEASIREEILKEIDEDSIVTRTRYGAEVLNVRNLMFFDIDHPTLSLFNLFKKPDVKADAIKRIKKLAPRYPNLTFRIYETHKGIRAIILGSEFEAKSKKAQRMMKAFNCDRLYIFLCKKQNCFRARLTPKPHRMKIQKRKFAYPYDVEEMDEMNAWIAHYNKASGDYSTCHFVESVGANALDNAIVRYHDDITRAHKKLPLA